MNKIRNYLSFLSFIVGFSILITSCSKYNEIYSPATKKYTGEEIFDGIYFFKNDILNHVSSVRPLKADIDQLKSTNKQFKRTMHHVSDITVIHIYKQYPNYFKELEDAMYSGNAYRIEQSLHKGSKLIEQALLSPEHEQCVDGAVTASAEGQLLKNKVASLDLNNQQDMDEFNFIVENLDINETTEASTASLVWAVVAFVYAAACAVSAAVALYTAVTKVNVWDPFESVPQSPLTSRRSTISKENAIVELKNFFAQK